MTTHKIISLALAGSCSLIGVSHAAPAPKAPARTRARARTKPSAPSISNTRVVPGASIGRVALGDSQDAVRRKLGAPAASFKLNNGLSSDLWRSAVAKRWDGQKHTFEVVYRRGVAVQIEATNPVFTTSRGLGLKSSDAAWQRAYGRRDENTQFKYKGGKPDQGYDDWIGAGLALEYQLLGEDGDEGAPIQMHTLIVHYRGVPVIPDPGGSPG